MSQPIAAIAIGRNEGERLVRCLASLQGQVSPIVYVDSGSDDGSVEAARAAGAEVVELDMSIPFTAARARNEGLAKVVELVPEGDFVQFLDGDCVLDPDWMEKARAALAAEPDLAVVCGRRREMFPEASLWNRLIDEEWDTPVGEAKACGGDALIRRAALAEVGGYPDDLIAGEEPEMCYRMRKAGWRIRRIDAEMTLHYAALTKFSQWWKRTRRAGHAYAAVAARHGHEEEGFRRGETRRALIWGAGVPLVAVLGAIFVSPWFLAVLLAWPLQVLRITAKGTPFVRAFFLTLGKVPEAFGVFGFWKERLTGARQKIIEYK